MTDLSIPFLNLADITVEGGLGELVSTAATNATNVAKNVIPNVVAGSNKGLNLFVKKYWLYVIVGIIGLVIVYRLMQSDARAEAEAEQAALDSQPKESNLEAAQKWYHLFKNTADPEEKLQAYQYAIRHFEFALSESPDVRIALTLAKLYHEGVPELEIPPNGEQAVQFYSMAIRAGNTRSLLDLASIYHWGLAKFPPVRSYAQALYALLSKVGTAYDQGIARDRLRQLLEEDGKVLGAEGGIDGAIVQNFASDLLGGSPFAEKFASISNIGASPKDIGKDNLTEGIDDEFIASLSKEFGQDDPGNRNMNVERLGVIKNNPQSARDHIVVNTAKVSLEKLKAKTHLQIDVQNTLKQIKKYIENNVPSTNSGKRDKIMLVLKHLAQSQYSTDYEATKELDALVVVWNRIFTVTDLKKRKVLVDNLMNEMSECIEYGELICSSGIITRMLDALNFIDPNVKILPEWMLRDEMLSKAAQLRDALLKKAPGKVRDALESPRPTQQDQIIAKNFTAKFKRELFDRFTKTYVEPGIMTEDLLKTQLNEWIDNMF